MIEKSNSRDVVGADLPTDVFLEMNTSQQQHEELPHQDFTVDKEAQQPVQLHGQEVTGLKFVLIILGLALSIFVAAMDNTIVSTALTKITSEFQALNQVTWVASSYLLTSTALQPLYGKFSDIFGRKATMLFALTIFLVGSIVCGASTNIIMLIVFRAIAGVGGGGLISLSVIIISDVVPLDRRGMYMGMVGANFAIASVAGPLIGGALTDKVSWRWAFYINLPVCALAILVIFFFLRLPTNPQNLAQKLRRIDYLGTFTLVGFIILFVLGLNWGGNEYPWSSSAVIGALVVGGVLLIGFIYVELRVAPEPIIASRVLVRNVISANCTAFLNGAVFFTAIIYTPIYFQMVKKESAIVAGLELLPLMLGVVVCSIFSGIFMSKTGVYRPLSRCGTFLALLGTCLMGSLMRPDISKVESVIFLLILGLGIGLCIQTNTIASQAAVAPRDVAVVTSLVSFSQTMGGVIGLAILGAVFSNVVEADLARRLPPGYSPKQFTASLVSARDPTIATMVEMAYVEGYKYIFLGGIAFLALSFISSLFLVHIPLRKPGAAAPATSDAPGFSH